MTEIFNYDDCESFFNDLKNMFFIYPVEARHELYTTAKELGPQEGPIRDCIKNLYLKILTSPPNSVQWNNYDTTDFLTIKGIFHTLKVNSRGGYYTHDNIIKEYYEEFFGIHVKSLYDMPLYLVDHRFYVRASAQIRLRYNI